MKVCDENNSSMQQRRGLLWQLLWQVLRWFFAAGCGQGLSDTAMEKGDCCNGFCNGVSRQWLPVGWKPNPKQNETRRSCWAGRRCRWAGQYLHWVDRHNQLLLRLLLTEQRVGKTQRELGDVEIRTRLGLSGRVTVGFYRSWRSNWRDETTEEKTEENKRNTQKNVASKGAVLLMLSLKEKRT